MRVGNIKMYFGGIVFESVLDSSALLQGPLASCC